MDWWQLFGVLITACPRRPLSQHLKAMAYCLTPLPRTAREAIHAMLEGLDRIAYVRAHGGTPSALAFDGFIIEANEHDWQPNTHLHLLFIQATEELCVGYGLALTGYFRRHIVRMREPCALCLLGGRCRLRGDCVWLHTWCRAERIDLCRYSIVRALTRSEYQAAIRDNM